MESFNKLPAEVLYIINNYASEKKKLLSWIDLNKLDWDILSENPSAIDLLKDNLNKINWDWLSGNPSAIDLLTAYPDRIDWDYLSENPAAINLLKANPDKINWIWLSHNPAIFEDTFDSDLHDKLINLQ